LSIPRPNSKYECILVVTNWDQDSRMMTDNDQIPRPPPAAVLEAFKLRNTAHDPPVLLDGGMGTTWKCGGAILKRTDIQSSAEVNWCSSILSSLYPTPDDLFRLAKPIVAKTGEWTVDGWYAQSFLPGMTSEGNHDRWEEVLSASRSFHRRLEGVCPSPPTFIQERTHRWAKADRFVWSEDFSGLQVEPELDIIPFLIEHLRPLSKASLDTAQIIHGDMGGNVLFGLEDGVPPAIIDFTPYWHPVAFAEAMIVIDGMLWYGAPSDLAIGKQDDWEQLLVRALLFRSITLNFIIQTSGAVEFEEELVCFRRVFHILLDSK